MIEAYLTDPGFALTVRWSLALVFLLAVIHKLKAPVAFKATMKNYRLLPDFLLTPFLYAVIAAELAAVAALTVNSPLGSSIAADQRQQLLLLLAAYHRLIRLPASVELEADQVLEALPALLDLADLLLDGEAPEAETLRQALNSCRTALSRE